MSTFIIFLHQSTLIFFLNDTASIVIYTLSLHDALPICLQVFARRRRFILAHDPRLDASQFLEEVGHVDYEVAGDREMARSEEHTSELQSHVNLVCRLLLEKKKKKG